MPFAIKLSLTVALAFLWVFLGDLARAVNAAKRGTEESFRRYVRHAAVEFLVCLVALFFAGFWAIWC